MNNKQVREKKIYYTYQGRKELPLISISGMYLIKAGWNVGQVLEIRIENDQIIITRKDNNNG
jgi:hypothetical protein